MRTVRWWFFLRDERLKERKRCLFNNLLYNNNNMTTTALSFPMRSCEGTSGKIFWIKPWIKIVTSSTRQFRETKGFFYLVRRAYRDYCRGAIVFRFLCEFLYRTRHRATSWRELFSPILLPNPLALFFNGVIVLQLCCSDGDLRTNLARKN